MVKIIKIKIIIMTYVKFNLVTPVQNQRAFKFHFSFFKSIVLLFKYTSILRRCF